MKSILGTFQRDGQFRYAYTPGEVTSLRNAGWSPIGEADAAPDPEPQTVTQMLIEDESPTIANPSGNTPQPAKQKDETK